MQALPIPPSPGLVLKLSRLPSGLPEIFPSVQGEGPTRGLPSVFVRLALCNLRCSWCDTKYTWDWQHYRRDAEIVETETEAVLQRVSDFGHHNVVITGGEPLLQQGALTALITALKGMGRRIEVETNGTIVPLPSLAEAVDQWNVSPKLANSQNPQRQREVSGALSWFAARPNAIFKLVVSEPPDLEEVRRLLKNYGIPGAHALAMPQAQDRAELATQDQWLRPASQAAGIGFSPRLQISLWDGVRGR